MRNLKFELCRKRRDETQTQVWEQMVDPVWHQVRNNVGVPLPHVVWGGLYNRVREYTDGKR